MVLTAPPTVVEVTRSVEERQDDGDDASARLAGEFLPRGDGNPAQLAVRRRRVFCCRRTGNNEARRRGPSPGAFLPLQNSNQAVACVWFYLNLGMEGGRGG